MSNRRQDLLRREPKILYCERSSRIKKQVFKSQRKRETEEESNIENLKEYRVRIGKNKRES